MMFKDFLAENMQDVLFTRNSFRRYLYIAIILILLNCCFIAYLYINLMTEPAPEYFATTSDGRIINISPRG
jgi:hypothetical protein